MDAKYTAIYTGSGKLREVQEELREMAYQSEELIKISLAN